MTEPAEKPGDNRVAGLPTDRFGGPTVDPTRNVLDLFEAGAKAAAELRTADQRYAELSIKRADDLRASEDRHAAEQFTHLYTLHEQRISSLLTKLDIRFEAVQMQFHERDKRTEQVALSDKTAVVAALQAQKESAASTNEATSAALLKMENSFGRSIEQGQELLRSNFANLTGSLNEIKGRLDRGEGKTSVSDPAVSEGMHQLTTMVKELARSRDAGDGKSAGIQQFIGWIVAGIALLGFMLTQMQP